MSNEISILFGHNGSAKYPGGIPFVKTGRGKAGADKARQLFEEAKSQAKKYGKNPRGVVLATNGVGEFFVEYIGHNGY